MATGGCHTATPTEGEGGPSSCLCWGPPAAAAAEAFERFEGSRDRRRRSQEFAIGTCLAKNLSC